MSHEMTRKDDAGKINRRQFAVLSGSTFLSCTACRNVLAAKKNRPNVIYVFADQWRASAAGYSGNPDVKTPHLDALAAESVNFKNAVSCCPVCSPARASMITGQYPLTHGIFVNDVHFEHRTASIADCFNGAGYYTGYIGKWHLDGRGRSAYIPPDRRQGFQFWQALECTHNYHNSAYYDNNDPEIKKWKGYDAFDQTRHAMQFIQDNRHRPFMLFLSWGPPHDPYLTAPEAFHKLYDSETLQLRPNVPEDPAGFIVPRKWAELKDEHPVSRTRQILAGYYAHCTALDECVGLLQEAIRDAGLEQDTIFVFTSDHGDMLGSHGLWNKQWPYDESARVPFLLKYPRLNRSGSTVDAPINTPDIMPTLCELCGIPVPTGVEGMSYTSFLHGEPSPTDFALIANYHPFGEWVAQRGGKEWRGIRSKRYTYVEDLNGPWLLYDNQHDPYQACNLINRAEMSELQEHLAKELRKKLRETKDLFEPGMNYIRKWGYPVNELGSVPYVE
jgi:arylsulfatase A-like enzyme